MGQSMDVVCKTSLNDSAHEFSSGSLFTRATEAPQLAERTRSLKDLSSEELDGELERRKQELDAELENDLKRLAAERKEGLYKLDWELAEAIEALHDETARKANDRISQHREVLDEIERLKSAADEDSEGEGSAESDGGGGQWRLGQLVGGFFQTKSRDCSPRPHWKAGDRSPSRSSGSAGSEKDGSEDDEDNAIWPASVLLPEGSFAVEETRQRRHDAERDQQDRPTSPAPMLGDQPRGAQASLRAPLWQQDVERGNSRKPLSASASSSTGSGSFRDVSLPAPQSQAGARRQQNYRPPAPPQAPPPFKG